MPGYCTYWPRLILFEFAAHLAALSRLSAKLVEEGPELSSFGEIPSTWVFHPLR